MNTTYRKNLKDVATACKNYTDKKIDDLKWELGSHTLDVESDTTTAYTKNVPTGTIGCVLDKIGGMSYKNLLNPNLINTNSLSITDYHTIQEYGLENNTNYTLSFQNLTTDLFYFRVNWSSSVYTSWVRSDSSLTFNTSNYEQFSIVSDRLYNSSLYNAMLNKGSTALPYQPYFEGIRDSAVTSVVSKGKNLLNIPDVAETTTNGITYKVENGVLTISGTTSSRTTIELQFNNAINNSNEYIFSLFNPISYGWGVMQGALYIDNVYSTYSFGTNFSKTFSNNSTFTIIRFILIENNTFNFTAKPMLVKGSTAPTEFKPYIQPITKQIPAEVQALTGYGWGVNNTCYNYIYYDITRKKWYYVQKVGRVDLGSLNYDLTISSGRNIFRTHLTTIKSVASQSAIINALSSIYNVVSINATWVDKDMSFWEANSDYIAFVNNDYNDTTAFKTAMSGVFLYYELATPVETDISQYLDNNFIEVEPNGTITFNNTYNQAVPSEVSYLVEEVKSNE